MIFACRAQGPGGRVMRISEHYQAIAQCNRCGFCQVACPVFRATGHEAGVARGRLALLRAVIEGRLPWSAGLEEDFFACLLCGACTTNCFPAIRTADLVVAAREQYLEQVGRKPLHRLLFDHLLPYPDRLRLAARAVAMGKRSGLSNVAGALGLLRIFGRDLPRSEKIVDRFPARSLREKFKPGCLEGRGTGPRIGYFVGCGPDLVTPDAAEASIQLLLDGSRQVTVLDNCCCGLPAWSYGDRQAARKLAEKNLNLLRGGEFDLIVTDCSSCASFLKTYPHLFPEESPQRAQAEAAARLVVDLVQWLSSTPPPPVPRPERTIVTYHDPCHASRGQGLAKEPRAILRSLPGVDYRELPEADWCCGGAGSYALSHFELAMKVLSRKMDNLERTGASVLATSCPSCMVQLRYGVRMRNLPVKVCHISEILRGQAVPDVGGRRSG